MSEIKVGKMRGRKISVYVGRPSALGNPFAVQKYGRKEAVALYEKWLREQIAARNVRVTSALNEIWVLSKRFDVELLCWCAPEACHADVVKKVLEETFAKRQG